MGYGYLMLTSKLVIAEERDKLIFLDELAAMPFFLTYTVLPLGAVALVKVIGFDLLTVVHLAFAASNSISGLMMVYSY